MYSSILVALIIGAMGVHAQCNAGQYNNNGVCTDCAAGTYSTSGDVTSCTRAQKGYYVPTTAQTSQTPCGKGTYTDARASTACTDCPAGYFNSVQHATGCCQCCAGFFQANTGAVQCKQCPVARPNSSPGATANNQCSATMGMYAPVASCDQNGRFCPAVFANGPSAAVRKRELQRCTKNQTRCATRDGRSECVDTQEDLWSCGGCITESESDSDEPSGLDCTMIPNVNTVACHKGKCTIGSCASGYMQTKNGTACETSDDLPQY